MLVEAADWLHASGQPLWRRDYLVPEKVRPSPDEGTLFLGYLAGEAVGAFILLYEDPFFWPDAGRGEALYLHKLVVRRSAAGRGLGRKLVAHALAKAREEKRRLLRLDSVPRPKLCAFYESAGFRHHSDRTVDGLLVRRYEQSTQNAR